MKKRGNMIKIILILLFIVGCSNSEINYEEKAKEAITNQNYKSAEKYAKRAVKENEEAKYILEYIKYEDNMLLATFFENDENAMRYIASIINDINKEDPRYEASALVLAAAWGKTEMVKILIDANADPNYSSDKDGLTALMWACKSFYNQYEMVEILLQADADINAKSLHGETAISIAEQYGNQDIVELIKKYGD